MVKGGYVLSFRHTDASIGSDSFGPFSSAWWKSCSSNLATQLSVAGGYNNADSIGQSLNLLRTFGVDFDTVRTSEYCRCRETAEKFKLVGVPLKESPVLTYYVYDEANRYVNTMAFYGNLAMNDKNHIAVTHSDFSANLPSTPYLNSLQPGDAAVFKKQAAGNIVYAGTITLNDWRNMSRP
jgi:hypothetical protein